MMGNRALTLSLAVVIGLAAGLLSGHAAGASRTNALGLPPLVGLTERLPAHLYAGFGVDGFDPVSFFLPEGPRAGSARHEALHSGVAWRFASAANRAAFAAAPERFMPRLGGHDPVALAKGRLVQARARHFAVLDGRLYLFRSAETRARFLADPTLARASEQRWIAARRELVAPIASN